MVVNCHCGGNYGAVRITGTQGLYGLYSYESRVQCESNINYAGASSRVLAYGGYINFYGGSTTAAAITIGGSVSAFCGSTIDVERAVIFSYAFPSNTSSFGTIRLNKNFIGTINGTFETQDNLLVVDNTDAHTYDTFQRKTT
jgi:hypothetical protein